MKKIILLLISILIGIVAVVFGYLWDAPRNGQLLRPFFPKTQFSIENAPSQSLLGEVSSASGNVSVQSRADNNFMAVTKFPVKLQQGDEVFTLGNGKATINFQTIGDISLSPNTLINIVQTLSENFVVEQKQGIATYAKTGIIPVSVRSLDLLINIDEGDSTVSVDKDSSNIIIAVNSGSITVAFNDTDNNTNILTISEGKKYLFNNNTKSGNTESL